jgi:oligoendopeptidase F
MESAMSNSAAGVAWDLRDLYSGINDPKIAADLAAARKSAEAFEAKYRGKIATLSADSAEFLRQSVRELEQLYEVLDKPLCYASLVHAAKTDVPAHGALLSKTREERTAINKHLIFFDLEFIKTPDDVVKSLLASPVLSGYRHFLEQKLLWKPYYLSEGEEKILDEKAITGKSAFGRLFEETTSSMKFPFKDQMLSQQEILARLYDPDRETRRLAALGTTQGLEANSRLLTFVFNTIVQDHQSDCRLRKYPGVMFSRNLANEISAEVVEALMSSVEKRFDLVQRYYRLKRSLLGYDKLYDYDRYAPIFGDLPGCDWATGREIVQESYDALSPEAGGIIRQFFEKNWIDAELRPGKRGGAFASSTVPSVHPYILMNYTERLRDVMTLAHELGHGLHQYLARKQGYFQSDTPLTTAETASVFGEMLTFRRLQERFPDPKLRLAMLCGKIEDAFATVFRQTVLTRFEQRLHKARETQGELSAATINELWQTANREMFGDAVEMTDGYSSWWSYIGHFIRSPFYCYAYAFGELLVLALFQKYKQDGQAFVPKYLELLKSGGKDAPPKLLEPLGCDINDPGFWNLGLTLLEGMVAEAEQLGGLQK